MIDRRLVLAGLAAAALPAAAAPGRDRVILLGTKGGPTPTARRMPPATALVLGGKLWVVDCGNGVANQLARAGIPLASLAHIFVTHNHSDHVADVVTLPLLAWASGLKSPVSIHGPVPLGQIVADGLAAARYDIAVRMREEALPPLVPLLAVDERDAGGVVLTADGVTVTSALVDHQSVRPAFAYRFDTPARSIVISGDTTFSPALIRLARNADVLIHEAIYAPAIDRIAAGDAALREHLIRSHTTTEDVGRVAAAAGVGKLVLSHLVPGDDPGITDAMWLAGVRRHYRGPAVVGRDLMAV